MELLGELIGIFIITVFPVCACKIASRAGYGWAWGLLAVIPLVNIIALGLFAFRPWPRDRSLLISENS